VASAEDGTIRPRGVETVGRARERDSISDLWGYQFIEAMRMIIGELTNFMANGRTYEMDTLIWSTGFKLGVLGSQGSRCGVRVTGRASWDIENKWAEGVANYCSSRAQFKRAHRLIVHLLLKVLLRTLLRSSQNVLGELVRLSRLPRWLLSRRKRQSKPGQGAKNSLWLRIHSSYSVQSLYCVRELLVLSPATLNPSIWVKLPLL
jgi:hypothetical protein